MRVVLDTITGQVTIYPRNHLFRLVSFWTFLVATLRHGEASRVHRPSSAPVIQVLGAGSALRKAARVMQRSLMPLAGATDPASGAQLTA